MKQLFSKLFGFLFSGPSAPSYETTWEAKWSDFLESEVSFYKNLKEEDREIFERRVLLFLHSTNIESSKDVEVTNEDCLLIASSAIIPVWRFPKWHYFNLKAVYLLPASFDHEFVCGRDGSVFTGMVGNGPLHGKMALSKPHLHLGFKNSRDKHNVGIHEFVHLIDMADGNCDGFPERLVEYKHSIPWFDFIRYKITEIDNKNSNIREYGATNNVEFFSVVSEYFFERPELLQKKHPKLCSMLESFYQQSVEDIAHDRRFKKNDPCPCGSGKKYKRCCFVAD